ncbi:hypothetical protein BN988_02627 [Oceanobacillus picturae]|uniref:Uncharacterized protein n=1 Tax=Oceanobacillus picturae TaxID=171693 RepID=W9BCQ4_9BACI|nr:hypothetical protein BN988_02627 [Oceanobacillus picturae]
MGNEISIPTLSVSTKLYIFHRLKNRNVQGISVFFNKILKKSDPIQLSIRWLNRKKKSSKEWFHELEKGISSCTIECNVNFIG